MQKPNDPEQLDAAQRALGRARQAAGSSAALARQLTNIGPRVSRQTLSSWDVCPGGRVLDVEAITGIPCWELRPDLYPPERFACANEAGASV